MWVEKLRLCWLRNEVSVILLVRMWVEKLYALFYKVLLSGHPPCEDVSWKIGNPVSYKSNNVILLVRMWVEKTLVNKNKNRKTSHPPCEDVSWKFHGFKFFVYIIVIRLVRMWVEKMKHFSLCHRILSSSLWGCELKTFSAGSSSRPDSHPPCEDVSWKIIGIVVFIDMNRHPPCEDVSWKKRNTSHTVNRFNVILLVRMWVEKSYIGITSR